MASKKQTPKAQPPTPKACIDALCAAGYTLDGFTRQGDRLTIRLVPALLRSAATSNFQALEACAELGLQADCHVFAAVPQDLLMVSVDLPPASQTDKSEIGNQQSEIK